MPLSGSTLMEQIQSSHHAIAGLGELVALDNVLMRPMTALREKIRLHEFFNGSAVEKSGLVDAYARSFDYLDRETFRAMGEQYLQASGARRKTGRPFFTDKTVRNFFYVGLIHLILPNAKIIDARH